MIDVESIAPLLTSTVDELASFVAFLRTNGLNAEWFNELYAFYKPRRLGCNRKRPFMLNEWSMENFTIEYAFIQFIFRFAPGRDASYEIVSHEIDFSPKTFYADKITLKVMEREEIHYETYWFGKYR